MALKKYFPIIFILLLSAFLYFYKLNKIPSGFYEDEASVAFNAISIAKTGKDEYGFAWPIYFRLMGSYTPSLFIYISAFLTKFFGSAPAVFRSLTVISTLVCVFVFYLFTQKLNIYKLKSTPFWATLFFAISPWIIINARVGYETTFGFTLYFIGLYFLFTSLKSSKNMFWAIFFLSVSTYTSHNERFLSPIFLILFLIIFKKMLTKKEILFGLFLNIPNLLFIRTNAFWIKSSQFTTHFLGNFLTYFSPKTLFYATPDIDLQHNLPKLSMLFNWMVFPYFVGLFLLFKKFKNPAHKFILLVLFLPIIPAVFSSPFISSQKILTSAPAFLLIIGLGLDNLLKTFNTKINFLALSALATYSLLVLFTSYFVLFPKEMSNPWDYGYDQLAEFIKTNPQENFLIDDTRNERIYILLLYNLNYPPETYQKEVNQYFKNNYYSAPSPENNYNFGNIEVRPISWEKDPQKDLLIVGDKLSISESQAKEHGLTKIKELTDPLGNIIFVIYKTTG